MSSKTAAYTPQSANDVGNDKSLQKKLIPHYCTRKGVEGGYTKLHYEIMGMLALWNQNKSKDLRITDGLAIAISEIIDFMGMIPNRKGTRPNTFEYWDDIKSHMLYFMIKDPMIYKKLDMERNWRGFLTRRLNIGFMKAMTGIKRSKKEYAFNYCPKDYTWLNSLQERGWGDYDNEVIENDGVAGY